MTLPLSGSPISLGQVNTELGSSPTANVSLNDTNVRSLAAKLSGTIAMSDLHGKSNDGLTAAYYFDGSDGVKINAAANNSANLTFGTGDFTVEFWMKANTTQTTYATIIDSSANNTGVYVGIAQGGGGTPGKLSFFAQQGASSLLQSANTVTDNTWRHIACVKFANTGMLFVNGVKEANTATGAWSTVTNAFLANGHIGRSSFGAGTNTDNTYTGWLSNLRVVKDRAIYTANFTPPTRTLAPIPNTSLLTLNNSTIVDATGNNFSLTAKNIFPELTLTEIPPITATVPVIFSSSNVATVNVYSVSKSAGWDGNNGLVIVTINNNVVLSSPSTGSFAMVIDDGFYGGLKLINNGTIVGKGGIGGNGGTAPTLTSATGGSPGLSGGPALSVLGPVRIQNVGRIAGGGGGGGGGGGSCRVTPSTNPLAVPPTRRAAGGGGGGGGIGIATGGAGGAGVNGNGGAGGTSTTTTAGAAGAAGVNGVTAGAGGAGGGYGSSGATGGTGNGNVLAPAGGAAGAAGSAIVGVSKVTFISRGTINGAESG